MKKLLLGVLTALAASSAYADTIALAGGGSLISTAGFSATTGVGSPSAGTPYWNNASGDGLNQNAGYFLTGTGFATNFLGTTPVYAGTTPASTTNATNFSFLRDASSVNVSLLFATASTNNLAGNEVGIYDVANPNTKTVISSSLPNSFNGSSNLGAFNTSATYGFYATVCITVGTCNTFYTNSALNTGGLTNQHFALFLDNSTAQTARTYYLALERLSPGPVEGYGDFNDLILQISTGVAPSGVPEPATLSFVGLGIVGIALSRLRKKQ